MPDSGEPPVNLQEILTAELAADIRESARAHARYLQVMDRTFLAQYSEGVDQTGGRIAELNTASHAPTAQPFVVPNFVKS